MIAWRNLRANSFFVFILSLRDVFSPNIFINLDLACESLLSTHYLKDEDSTETLVSLPYSDLQAICILVRI